MPQKPQKRITIRRIALAPFIIYVLVILFLLVIPNNYRGHNVIVGGLTWERWAAHISRNINLVPLRGLSEELGFLFAGQDVGRHVVYLAGNLVGFAPLGFFLPALFVRQRKFPAFLITVPLSIALLETAQLLTMSGSFDIDDVILNTAGACVGFWVVRKFVRLTTGINNDQESE